MSANQAQLMLSPPPAADMLTCPSPAMAPEGNKDLIMPSEHGLKAWWNLGAGATGQDLTLRTIRRVLSCPDNWWRLSFGWPDEALTTEGRQDPQTRLA